MIPAGLALAALVLHALAFVVHGAMLVQRAADPSLVLTHAWCAPADTAGLADGSAPASDRTGYECPICAVAAVHGAPPPACPVVAAPVALAVLADMPELISAHVARFELKPDKSRGPPSLA